MSAPVQPRVGREAVGQTRIPHQGAAASVGPLWAKQWNDETVRKFRLRHGNIPSDRPLTENARGRSPAGKPAGLLLRLNGKIRLQRARFSLPMGRAFVPQQAVRFSYQDKGPPW